jgi:DNA modification methylase
MNPLLSAIAAQQYKDNLVSLLSGDLDFHSKSSKDFTHDLHAFPAKFPPQLPRHFIEQLTEPNEIVLDPMSGSGTTILEGFLLGRRAIGCDIDPLALLLSKVKTHPLPMGVVSRTGITILEQARISQRSYNGALGEQALNRFDEEAKEFINYWFHPDAQYELLALLELIEQIEDEDVRAFFEVTLSSIIITKSGGVSLAFDLAHTRPHKVKDKVYRSPLKEFEKRLQRNFESLRTLNLGRKLPFVSFGDAQNLPLRNNLVDLIVTSPPYASNAIDYMRAHKFSLVWFGHQLQNLTQLRSKYIGGEVTKGFEFEQLPVQTTNVVSKVASLDPKKGLVLSRYYSEMSRALGEMFRVLKPGKAAIVVVGSSNMRSVDTLTHICLAEIGECIGFEIPHIGVRQLDRNRRMLPVTRGRNNESQIENRMHEEFVIGFYKPLV